MEYLHLKSSQSDRPEPLKNWLIEKFFTSHLKGVYFLRLDWFLRTALFHLSGSNAQRYEFPAPSNLVRRAKNWFGYGSKPWHHDLQPPEMGLMGHPSPPCWSQRSVHVGGDRPVRRWDFGEGSSLGRSVGVPGPQSWWSGKCLATSIGENDVEPATGVWQGICCTSKVYRYI